MHDMNEFLLSLFFQSQENGNRTIEYSSYYSGMRSNNTGRKAKISSAGAYVSLERERTEQLQCFRDYVSINIGNNDDGQVANRIDN